MQVLALEAALSSGSARLDERLGVLLRAHQDPALAAEAGVRIRTIVLDAPPRSAWAHAYQVAQRVPGTPPEPVLLQASAAALQLPDPDPEAWSSLDRLARADAPDARRLWGEALLFHGRVDQAADSELISPLHRAWAHVARGDASLALGTVTAPAAQPCLDTNADLACGALLLELGWPGAARVRAEAGLADAPGATDLTGLLTQAQRALALEGSPTLADTAARAESLVTAGEPAHALDALLQASAQDPAAWVVLGPALGLAFDLGRPQVAESLLRAALADVDRPKEWASMLQDLGRVTSAGAEAHKTAGNADQALAALQLAHVLLPEDPAVLTSLGGITWQLGQPQAALVAYTAAASLVPDDRRVLEARFRLMVQLDQLDQAAALLTPLPRGDARVDALHQELQLEAALRSVQAQIDAGDTAGAETSVAQLRQRFDGWPRVQALHGDVLLASGKPEEAAAAYERARRRDPDNPWHALGEARALGAMGLWPQAHALLDQQDGWQLEALGDALDGLREALLRAEGDALRASGDWEEAWARYDRLLAGDPDAWTLTGAGALYLAADRPDDAITAYDRALGLAPDNAVAARGRIWALVDLGQLTQAEAEAQVLVAAGRDPANDALLDHVHRLRQLQEARVLRFSQQPDAAEALLLQALEKSPGDPALTLSLGWLYEQEDRPHDAWWCAWEVLLKNPTDADALHLLRRVGHGRAMAVHRAWQDAVDAGAGREVSDSLPALRLAIELERAEDMAARGLHESASELIGPASQELAGADPQAWLAVGDAWSALGDLDAAWAAYELALAHAPEDPEAAVKLAGCLEHRGRASHAQRVLDRAWTGAGDPRVALALADLQERRGLLWQSTRTREQLLSVAAATSDAAPTTELGVSGPPVAIAGAAGVTWLSRAGETGQTALSGWLLPVGATVGLPGRWQLEAQAVPHQLSDGENTARGFSLSAGAATRPGTPMSVRGRVGTGPLGSAPSGHWTWDANLGAGLGELGEVTLGFHRAPVLGSLASWSGAVDVLDRPYGAVMDTWVSGMASLRWKPATNLGLVARAGAMSGDDVEPIAWQQIVAWGHRALRSTDDRVRVGVDGLVFTHDRRSDAFTGGEAGAFTPTRFGQVSARLEGTWTHPTLPVRVCAAGGAGPQYQDGESLRFADAGWALTGDAVLVAHWRLADDWLVEGRAWGQATSTRWHQEVAVISLQRLQDVSSPLPAALPFSSPAHGPAVVPHRPCDTVPWERP